MKAFSIHAGLVLSTLIGLNGCKRELAGAPCPCLANYRCCTTRNVCIPDNASCSATDDPDPSSPTLVTSAPNDYWKLDGVVTEVSTGNADVTVIEAAEAQTWEGFGGAFNELGWEYLAELSEADRHAALELLFGDDGARLDLGRIPIGGNDYAVSRYTLNETVNDTEMAHFSLSRDKERLVPYALAAKAVRPSLRFWASPWTPPTWMKNGAPPASPFDGGNMTTDAADLAAYARYLVKFVQQYAELGIEIEAVAPQNEPSTRGSYPSCVWDPANYAAFIGQFLGPTLQAAKLDTHIMLGTMSNSTDDAFIDAVLADDRATSYVGVVGVQWNMLDNMARAQGSGLPLWQTEHMGGNCPFGNVPRCASIIPPGVVAPAPNDHAYAIESWNNLHDWIKAGVSSYSAWNMVLDSFGLGNDSTGSWGQNALLVVDTSQKTLTATPTYFVFRHLSRFVERGAKLIATTGGSALAFKNPSGAVVTVVFNAGAARPVIVAVSGKRFSFDMPESGWATLVLH